MALAIKQIETLLDQYEVFLVDAWGVLHDGHTLYPGAKATLELLKAADKRCLILSNAISRRDQFKSHLDELGLAPNLYNDVVTSGELCWQALKQGNNPMLNALGGSLATSFIGMRCFHLGASNRRGYTDGLDLEMVSDINDAQFILNTALGKVEQLGDYSAALEKAKKLDLPMVCPNPDVTAIKGGLPIMTAGAVGQLFEKMGGQVVYLGKPYQTVYDRCFSLFPSVFCMQRNISTHLEF